MNKETKNLDTIIEAEKKNFAKDTFSTIMKSWGIQFSNLKEPERTQTLAGILELAGIKLAKDPAGGLAIKIMEQRRRDSDVQERIRFAQAYNLAVALVGSLAQKDNFNSEKSTDKYKIEIEFWQKWFYQQLGNGDQNGNN